jgi:glycosyltransferase involved in cell wall biosynthesis
MRIAIDAREIKRPYTGTGMYVLNLIRALFNIDKENEYFLYVDADFSPGIALPVNFSIYPVKKHSSSKIQDQYEIVKCIQKHKPDVFHVTHHDVTPFLTNVPLVVTVLDIAWIDLNVRSYVFNQYYYWLTNLAVNKASRIVTISESTKNRVLNYFPDVKSKIEAIPIACDTVYKFVEPDADVTESLKKEFQLHSPYILYVGSFTKRKNLSLLLKAMQIVYSKYPDLKLVLAGKASGRDDVNFEDFDIKHPMIIIDRPKTELELKILYKNARMLVFPSEYEGFGLPVLEAMTSGCAVIAGDSTSLPEIVGDAGILVDTKDESQLALKVIDLLENDKLRAKMVLEGIEQSKKFDWLSVAQLTLKNYLIAGRV